MDQKLRKLLVDIQMSINEINEFLQDSGTSSFGQYRQNILIKRAIERNLEIIGEAMRRILDLQPDFPIENSRKIVGLRNQIIHAYDAISDENIWSIIVNHLPKLQSEVKSILRED